MAGHERACAPGTLATPDYRHGRGLPAAREEMMEKRTHMDPARRAAGAGLKDMEEVYGNGDLRAADRQQSQHQLQLCRGRKPDDALKRLWRCRRARHATLRVWNRVTCCAPGA